jgi:hypothetical protein
MVLRLSVELLPLLSICAYGSMLKNGNNFLLLWIHSGSMYCILAYWVVFHRVIVAYLDTECWVYNPCPPTPPMKTQFPLELLMSKTSKFCLGWVISALLVSSMQQGCINSRRQICVVSTNSLSEECAACWPSSNWNFEVVPRFLENFCTSGVYSPASLPYLKQYSLKEDAVFNIGAGHQKTVPVIIQLYN